MPHYCVNATLPYLLKLANNGLQAAVAKHEGLKAGVNTDAGKLTCEAVAISQNKDYPPLDELL